MLVREPLTRFDRPVLQDHGPLGDVGFEHGEVIVVTSVVVQIEPFEPDQ